MAVTVFWVEYITGESPGSTPNDNFTTPHVVTDANTINFGNISARDITTASNPVTAGDNSFDKYFTFQISGSYTQISNGKLWKSGGSFVTGETMQFSGNIAHATPSASDASDPDIPVATPLNNVGFNFLDSADVAAQDKTLPSGTESASSPGFFSGSRTSIMRFQALTTGSTPAGAVNQKTITMQYDRQ